ncbi:MAG: ribonuclease III [Clostridiales bacterium]|nr:ribonuclease III [Clostridiales bacterium]
MFDFFFDKMYNEHVENTGVQRLTPVGLAFIGDAVHTLYVREYVTAASDGVVGTLHTAASRLVNAKCQAAVLDKLISEGALTEDEADIARRAKNAHLHSRAKTASPDDYHKATALEAVIGYVHMSGDVERERELLELCVQIGLQVTAKP